MASVIEVLQYTLKPGTGEAFHAVMKEQSIPLHESCGLNVKRFGNSLDNKDKYYLVRAFSDISQMETELAQFYADVRWREGPRSKIINMIIESHRVVIPDNSLSDDSPSEYSEN
ncbi:MULTISPECIES: NIPSNAP family protein [Klebsiella]|uniref:NIPSNAP family protein n=1 Tax=Klebsiella TaxID=570 RepID=UPI000C290107|nr:MULTISPECIES: NIPSNAP family protein [Klebsiella]MCS6068808.1 NIPSNAP family protein [Klebsiella variicola subsp. variicola]NKD42275.1 NIPSNAP family protein [Escherichia coli]MCE7489016.1 NIPSNAP family protein [Klebsiella variicola]MCH6141763.1 NIPSNAP family protein [Klebsiella variicola]MCH6176702.1 NIPSNAP family protein [Klebsiella variicola]